jgi:lipoate-protein ligase A
MTAPWHRVVEETPRSVVEVLEGDERLLSAGGPAVRVGRFAEGAVSVGVSQRSTHDLEARATAEGLRFARRGSGGSSLLHLPGDVYWSVVLPRGHPRVGRGFVHRYAELGAGWPGFLRARGVVSHWGRPSATREEYCLLSSRGQALCVGARAIGGASQHVTPRALLHHGVVASSLRPELLERVFGLPEGIVASSLTSLEAEGIRLAADDLRALADALQRELGEPS